VPLVLEYEAAAMRLVGMGPLTSRDVQAAVDYLCSVGVHAKVHYLWRPYLRDPKDDMVLETAVAGGCGRIVTFNRRDFAGSEHFGVRIVTPQAFLKTIGDKP
jgi:predicted nucleic acid-binding protein